VPHRSSTETKLKTSSNCVNIEFSLFDFEGEFTVGDLTVGGQHLPAQLIGAANKTVIRELNVAGDRGGGPSASGRRLWSGKTTLRRDRAWSIPELNRLPTRLMQTIQKKISALGLLVRIRPVMRPREIARYSSPTN
jgi:hypothetical protein